MVRYYRFGLQKSTTEQIKVARHTNDVYELFIHVATSNGPFPFYMKFEKIQNRQKYHHSLKDHPMFSKIAKFGCEML